MKELFQQMDTRFTPNPRIHNLTIPENLWTKCPACRQLMYVKQLNDNLKVCLCGHHMRMSARERLFMLDPGSFEEEDNDLVPCDPLGFVSSKDNYARKLAASQQETGLHDAVISGRGTIDGYSLCITISDMAFIGGSMGSVFGEKIACAAERAAECSMPLLTINASGGARMHEGTIALMQMAKVSVALTQLSAAQQPHISLLVDPCYGGVAASYASAADVIIAEPGASIGFTGRRVIEQTIHQKLPANFQTAEFLLDHGMIDKVVPRSELRVTLALLLQLYAARMRNMAQC